MWGGPTLAQAALHVEISAGSRVTLEAAAERFAHLDKSTILQARLGSARWYHAAGGVQGWTYEVADLEELAKTVRAEAAPTGPGRVSSNSSLTSVRARAGGQDEEVDEDKAGVITPPLIHASSSSSVVDKEDDDDDDGGEGRAVAAGPAAQADRDSAAPRGLAEAEETPRRRSVGPTIAAAPSKGSSAALRGLTRGHHPAAYARPYCAALTADEEYSYDLRGAARDYGPGIHPGRSSSSVPMPPPPQGLRLVPSTAYGPYGGPEYAYPRSAHVATQPPLRGPRPQHPQAAVAHAASSLTRASSTPTAQNLDFLKHVALQYDATTTRKRPRAVREADDADDADVVHLRAPLPTPRLRPFVAAPPTSSPQAEAPYMLKLAEPAGRDGSGPWPAPRHGPEPRLVLNRPLTAPGGPLSGSDIFDAAPRKPWLAPHLPRDFSARRTSALQLHLETNLVLACGHHVHSDDVGRLYHHKDLCVCPYCNNVSRTSQAKVSTPPRADWADSSTAFRLCLAPSASASRPLRTPRDANGRPFQPTTNEEEEEEAFFAEQYERSQAVLRASPRL